MATIRDRIEVWLRARGADQYQRDTNQSADSTDHLGQAMFSLKKAGAVAGLALTAVAGALAVGFNQTRDFADKLAKLETRLGISTAAASEWAFAVDRAGISFDAWATSLQRQTRRLAEAAQGTGAAKDALEELGLSASDLVKLAPDKQFEVIAGAMEGVENQALKVALAMKIWDTEGVKNLNLVNQGTKALERQRAMARGFGLTIEGDVARKLELVGDGFTILSTAAVGSMRVIVTQFAEPVIQSIIGIIKTMGNASEAFDNFRSGFGLSTVDDLKDQMLDLQLEVNKAVSDYQRFKVFYGEFSDETVEAKDRLNKYNDELLDMHRRVDQAEKSINPFSLAVDELNETLESIKNISPGVAKGVSDIGQSMKDAKKDAENMQKVFSDFDDLLIQQGQLWDDNTDSIKALEAAHDHFTKKLSADAERRKNAGEEKDALAGLNEQVTAAKELEDAIKDIGLSMSKSIGDAVADSVFEFQSFDKLVKNIFIGVAKEIVSAFVAIGVQRLVLAAISKGAVTAETTASVTAAATEAAAWAPAAAAKTLATFGANVPVALAGITATYGLTKALSVVGFNTGVDEVPSSLAIPGLRGPDTVIARLEPKERVVDVRTNRDLKTFLKETNRIENKEKLDSFLSSRERNNNQSTSVNNNEIKNRFEFNIVVQDTGDFDADNSVSELARMVTQSQQEILA